jgi:prepilin-type N-terminal cleavage/methylation domain-containing protein
MNLSIQQKEMKPMAHTKGFSLIETLVAVAIASIAAMALMQVISHASNTSANVIRHFDSSIMMGLVATEINDTMQGRSMSVDDVLSARYQIDHPAIREYLQSTSYEIRLMPKEVLVGIVSTPALNSLAIQKVTLQNAQEKKTFFRLTSGLE